VQQGSKLHDPPLYIAVVDKKKLVASQTIDVHDFLPIGECSTSSSSNVIAVQFLMLIIRVVLGLPFLLHNMPKVCQFSPVDYSLIEQPVIPTTLLTVTYFDQQMQTDWTCSGYPISAQLN